MATGARPLWKPAAIYAHNRDTSQFPRDRKKRSSLLTTEWKWGGRGPKIPPICRTRDPTCSTILRHDMLVAALSRRLRCRSLDVSAKLAAPEYKRTRRTVPANADSGVSFASSQVIQSLEDSRRVVWLPSGCLESETARISAHWARRRALSPFCRRASQLSRDVAVRSPAAARYSLTHLICMADRHSITRESH